MNAELIQRRRRAAALGVAVCAVLAWAVISAVIYVKVFAPFPPSHILRMIAG